MINYDRIVPITKTDYLTMIGTILNLSVEGGCVVLAADTVEGAFTVPSAANILLANQPVKTLNFGEGVEAASVVFVAAHDFEGISVDGVAATIDDAGLGLDDIKTDGVTLYMAALSSGEVTIAAVSPSLE